MVWQEWEMHGWCYMDGARWVGCVSAGILQLAGKEGVALLMGHCIHSRWCQ